MTKLSCSIGTPPNGAIHDQSVVKEQIFIVHQKKNPPRSPPTSSPLTIRLCTPANHNGAHKIFAIKPDVPAYMKLSRNKCVFASQNSAVSAWSNLRSFDLYTEMKTL